MRDDRLVIDVSFDEQRGYVGTHADLRSPVDGPFRSTGFDGRSRR
jgi:hypothetical protein